MASVRVSARSEVGRVRSLNEDATVVGEYLWAVADGMGGHAAGDVASSIMSGALATIDRADLTLPDITSCIDRASKDIVAYAAANPSAAGLGTTVTGVAEVLIGGAHHWAIFNVGDSRVYRYFEGRLSRATIDHSEVEELIMAGRLTEAEARIHPLRNVITRSVGSSPPPIVDMWMLPQTAGERFLVCSDGLTCDVADAEIRDRLIGPDIASIVDELVALALRAGGRDNVSLILVEVVHPADNAPEEETNPRPTIPSENQC